MQIIFFNHIWQVSACKTGSIIALLVSTIFHFPVQVISLKSCFLSA